jgi:hypothetical protein
MKAMTSPYAQITKTGKPPDFTNSLVAWKANARAAHVEQLFPSLPKASTKPAQPVNSRDRVLR